ncbi:probable receptor-like serine/threonine-protein kinase At4g34500 isoform X2 [Magnolia sinica]|uniref:probable receptor-like serine/threonine-protein kinase At4g34500 isoform X2 n=1 Tax=Magnolia sinica TaxID=86752 RepID=UPI002658467E|nr:probable receptor-like serine/threonine-protein kinase At4g34500 isoform X2 [Magnolia sinica]
MAAGNHTDGGDSGNGLTNKLSEKTSILGLKVYVLIGIIVGCMVLVALLIFFFFCANRKSKKRRMMRVKHASGFIPMISKEIIEVKAMSDPMENEGKIVAVDLEGGEGKEDLEAGSRSAESKVSGGSASSSSAVSVDASNIGWGRWYGLRELEVATDGFIGENVIGEGGYGVVYRGVLPDSSVVAVKNLLNNKGQAEREFKVEVEAIGKVRHKNLVGLLGFCAEGTQRMLVYEYVENGNLEQWLHGDVGPFSPLTWDIRMKIAIGTAKGYVAPEYANTGMLNEGSDVYSFGVLLMEIISGRSPVDYGRPVGEVNLVDWFKGMVGSRRGEEVVDPLIEVQPPPRALKRVLLVCLRCIDLDAQKRPKMGHVVHMLEADEFPFRSEHRTAREAATCPPRVSQTTATRIPLPSENAKGEDLERSKWR